jgi:hypothetical protein
MDFSPGFLFAGMTISSIASLSNVLMRQKHIDSDNMRENMLETAYFTRLNCFSSGLPV